MGAASSVENDFNVAYMKPLLWEYEASKAVMEPAKARRNMVEFLTNGKYPFSEEQISKIKSAYDVCESEISELSNKFHEKWEKIVEEGGSEFRTYTQKPQTGGGLGPSDMMGGMSGWGIGMGMGIDMGFGMETEQQAISETDESPPDDLQARLEVSVICNKLQFTNRLPEYMMKVSVSYDGFQIGLKMSDRKKLLDKYLEDEADLLRNCEDLEAKSKSVVAECLQELSLSWTKEQEGKEGGAAAVVSTDITWGVSLQFLKDFLKEHPEIDENYTTGSVVYNIVIPETAASQETYVKAHLLVKPEQQQYVSDLRKGYRRMALPRKQRDFGVKPDECGLFAFLSHAWSMPFRRLVEIADLAGETALANKITAGSTIDDQRDASCYFWLDVFCKNQHTPAPAMQEFRSSILAPAKCVVAMSPVKALAVTRIWCLYEIWTASILPGVQLLPTYPRKEYETLMGPTLALLRKKEENKEKVTVDDVWRTLCTAVREELKVDIRKAEATRTEDIGTIMAMIQEESPDGVDILNKAIEDVIASALFDRLKVTHNLYT